MQEVTETKSLRRSVLGWFRLLRIPQLLTAPGDAMAGVAWLAVVDQATPAARDMFLLGGAALFLYAFGLVLNDLHDYDSDGRHRPERPLPRNQVSVPTAVVATVFLAGAGLALAYRVSASSFLNALLLLCLISVYDLLLKDVPALGYGSMGLCRAVSFLLIVPATRWFGIPGLLPVGLLLYVAAVALLARRSEGGWCQRWHAWLPSVFMTLVAFALLGWSASRVSPLQMSAAGLLLLAAVIATLAAGWRIAVSEASPQEARAAAGVLTCALLPFQAACLCLQRPTLPLAGLLLVCWPLALGLGRRSLASDLRRREAILAGAADSGV